MQMTYLKSLQEFERENFDYNNRGYKDFVEKFKSDYSIEGDEIEYLKQNGHLFNKFLDLYTQWINFSIQEIEYGEDYFYRNTKSRMIESECSEDEIIELDEIHEGRLNYIDELYRKLTMSRYSIEDYDELPQ